MEKFALLNERLVHLLWHEGAVRSPDELEAALPGIVYGDNRHGGGAAAGTHPGDADAVVRQDPAQVRAEAVRADLADKSGPRSQPGCGHRHVCGRAAWIGCK